MIYAEEKLSLCQIHQKSDEIFAAPLDFRVVAFGNAVNAQVHFGSTGHSGGHFLAKEEVRKAAKGLKGVDGIVVGHGDDGHPPSLKPVVYFEGIVVGFPAHTA